MHRSTQRVAASLALLARSQSQATCRTLTRSKSTAHEIKRLIKPKKKQPSQDKVIQKAKHTATTTKDTSPDLVEIVQETPKEMDVLVNDPEARSLETSSVEFSLPIYRLGDYVEAFSNGRYSGIVVSQKKISGRRQILGIMLRNGDVKEFSSDNVAFTVPGFVKTLDMSLDFDVNAETMDDPPRDKFRRVISDYQRTIFLKKGAALRTLNKMYSHFQGESTGEAVKVSLEELAKYAFSTTETPTFEQLHATFDYVVANNIHFTPSASVRITQLWKLRSAEEAKNITQIVDWIRSRSGIYTGFLERARALVEFYEAHADPKLGTLSPSALDMAKVYTSKLTDSDKLFIDFIAGWIKSPKVIVDSPHAVFVPTILKGLKCYDELFFDTSLATKFLRQIGMLKPWDNVSLLQTANVMQEWIWSDRAVKNEERMQHYARLFLRRESDNFADGMFERDECDTIRHDFGNLPVYTIDDPSAKEIDDGISIERIPGGATWLHVHIADPSAYIPPGHELANIMQQKVQTLYLPEQHFPILPNALSSEKFSLGATAQKFKDGSQYAMTFSAKLDDQGNLAAWKVRPSLVRNVQKIYYDDLDELYDKHSIPRDAADPLVDLSRSFTHPTSIPPAYDHHHHHHHSKRTNSQKSVIDEDAAKDLIDLYHLVQRHHRFRLQCGAVNFGFPSPNVSIDPNPLPLPAFSFTEPQYAAHLPAIRVSLDKSSVSPARKMIAETMIVGGRVATYYAKEHGVAMPYRTQMWPQNVSQAELDMRNEMLSLRDMETGKIKIADMIRYMEVLPPAALSTTPGQPHVLMGIPDGYARVTSPLRRYMDIVTHWQLKAHLLGKQAPFDAEALNRLGPRIEAREKLMSGLERKSVQFWVVELVRRLMAESHGGDMEWTCLVSRESKSGQSKLGASIEVASGTILELGIRGRLENVPSNLQVGQLVKARIRDVDASMQSIVLDVIQVE